MADLGEFISRRIGLNFPEERWPDLVRSIRAAAHDFGFSNTKSCIELLLSASLGKKEIEILASHLTVGETYFFRDKKMFEALEVHILRPLIETRGEKGRFLSMWSAGCASGEEAYSLAILVKKMIPDLENWRIVIQATDINPHFLKKARKGIYSEWSFRNTPPRFRSQYFTRTSEGGWEVLPEIRQMVHFSHHNLAEGPYPCSAETTTSIDIIICRNVLMYFTQDKGKEVIQGFYRCLGREGWLVVSPWEVPAALLPRFKAVRFPDVMLYRKDVRGLASAPEGLSARREFGVLDSAPAKRRSFCEKDLVPPRLKERPIKGLKWEPLSNPPFPHVGVDKREEGNREFGNDRVCQSETGTPIPDTHVDLARHYANMGMLPKAMKYCQKAISKDELNPALYFLQASILQEQGQIVEAITTLKKVLYLDHDFILAYFALGNLSATQGKSKEAEKCFQNALHLLEKIKKEDLLPGSGGMTAGGLAEIIHSIRRNNQDGPGKAEQDLFNR